MTRKDKLYLRSEGTTREVLGRVKFNKWCYLFCQNKEKVARIKKKLKGPGSWV